MIAWSLAKELKITNPKSPSKPKLLSRRAKTI
jgi:hypothetical protein